VAGLDNGADVRLGGIRTGVVSRIDLPERPDGKVTIVMNLKKATRDLVKQDSVASIHSEGLLGDRYLEVSFGSEGAPPVKDGDTIQSEPPLEFDALLKKADNILDSAQGTVVRVGQTVDNLDSITGKINSGQGTAGALVNDKKLYEQATAGVSAMQDGMEALKHNFLLRGFFKSRGYEDDAELAKHEIPRLPTGPSSQVFLYDPRKLFAKTDTAELKNRKLLDDAGKYLETEPYGLAVIAVSAGQKGDSEKERELTEARSAVIRDYLVDNFRSDDQKIKTLGLGKSKGGEPDGRAEIIVYPAPLR